MTEHKPSDSMSTAPRPSSSRKHQKTHTRYAVILSAGMAFLGSTTAITGLVLNHTDVLIITAAMLATLGGLYLLLRCWGKPVGLYTIFMMATVVTGSVILALSLKTYNTGKTSQAENSSALAVGGDGENAIDNTRSGGKPVSKNSSHTVVFEKAYTINATEGLELDDEVGTILLRQNEAKAPADLYFSDSPLLYTVIKDFFPYKPATRPTGDADKDQYESCASQIEADHYSATNIIGAGTVTPGLQYCVLTTQGRVALITLQEMIDAGDNSTKSSVSLSVKLWN